MTGSSVAGIITAVSTVLIALGGMVTAIGVFLPILRGTRANSRQIIEVHQLVNQRFTDQARYIERLIEVTQAAGVPVPRDSSLRSPGGGPA